MSLTDTVRTLHIQAGMRYCARCGFEWPCAAIRLADSHDALLIACVKAAETFVDMEMAAMLLGRHAWKETCRIAKEATIAAITDATGETQ